MMRIFFLLILVCVVGSQALAQAPPVSKGLYSSQITFSKRNATLEKIIEVIEDQTPYVVFYASEYLKKAGRVNVNVKNVSVQEFLRTCLANQPFTFNVDDYSIGLEYDPTAVVMKVPSIRTEFKFVQGYVVNTSDSTIAGATITISGSRKTFTASSDGRFSLKIPASVSQIEVSAVNYNTELIDILPGNTDVGILRLKKKPVVSEDPIVVVGYGEQKKSSVTGSISTIDRKDIGDRTTPNFVSALQGRVTGVDAAGNAIRIRGTTSFNFTEPLIVIDGFLGGSLNNINPNDIAGMEVLKDASSTAIYGARGANGVIVITTRSGKSGAVKCNINGFTGFASTTKRLDVLNSAQYVAFVTEALANTSNSTTIPARLTSDFAKVSRTDWQNEVFRNGRIAEFNIDFSGGSDNSTYYFSAGFRHEEGITIGPSSDDIYINSKNNFKIKKWFRAGDNLAFTYKISRGAAPWDVKSVVNMPPYLEVRSESNFWGYSSIDRDQDLGDNRNPVALSALTHPRLTNLGYNVNLWAEIEPLAGLVYRVQAGINGFNALSKIWNDAYMTGTTMVENNSSEKSSYSFYPVVETYLTYKKQVSEHDLTLMAGNSWQNGAQTGSIGIAGQNYQLTVVPNVFYAQTNGITNQDHAKQSFLSYFGRVNYQFKEQYLFTFNVRRDGSPRFAPTQRWATFPSVALGWKLHKIPQIQNLNIFDELKLRVSYGAAGNDGIGDFKYTSPIWTNGVYYPFGQIPQLYQGATVVENSSRNIRWETTISKSIGLDMAFMRNALQITSEYFFKNSKDILFTVPRAASLGYGIPPYGGGDALVNAASCQNSGFEFQVRYRHASDRKIRYTVNANFTAINNKVTSLGLGQPYTAGVNRTSIGNPIGYFYGYVAEGVFMKHSEVGKANKEARNHAFLENPGMSPQALSAVYYQDPSTTAGDIKFKDINGDGKVTATDQMRIGNSIPKFQYGLYGNLKYANFDLDVQFQGTGGYQIFYRGFDETRGMKGVQNQETYVLDRWKSEDEPGNGLVPRAVIGDPSRNNRPSTRMISNGDYFKLRQMSVGYSLPDPILKKMDLSMCRFYLSGSNIFTITPYEEFDPEYSGPNLTRGADWLNFPINPRYLVMGIKISL